MDPGTVPASANGRGFPTTLSILTNIFTERRERAKAIGLWAAMSGLGVVSGPITGGWILQHYCWGAVFLIMGPVAAVAIFAAVAWVPTSRDPAVPRLDWNGLILSTPFIGLKEAILDGMVDRVFAEIERPPTELGWKPPIRSRCVSAREVLARHPWAAPLMESRTNPGPETLGHHDAVLGCFLRGGLSLEMTAHAYALLDTHLRFVSPREVSEALAV